MQGRDAILEALDKRIPEHDVGYDVWLALLKIVDAMRRHGHGGTLLVVPDGDDSWTQCVSTVKWKLAPSFRRLPHQLKVWPQVREGAWDPLNPPDVKSRVEAEILVLCKIIGQLTAIDGAVVATRDLKLVGFGAFLKSGEQSAPRSVFLVEPRLRKIAHRRPMYRGHLRKPQEAITGKIDRIPAVSFDDVKVRRVAVSQLGGARHQSAAAFCVCSKSSIVFVASQDGSLSMMAWDDEKNALMVAKGLEVYLF